MDDIENVIYDENDIEDFEDYLTWFGIPHEDDLDEDEENDTDIRELYF